ncbi:hypothetical protein SIPHO075v1_p0094 [Vibrio phage PS65A.1]|nr:hypothetical protein SIPHO075v1_p0094 [Vibrio phage PS65A.1]
MKLKNLQIQLNGKGHLEHRITYVNENGTQCRETLCSGVDFAQNVIDCLENAPVLLKERDNALERATNITEYDEGMREAMKQIARACGKTFAVDIGYDNLPELVEELLARPDTTQPQLSEIRYVLHGDIQPCTVLYSDDTTTLLRLDEGDMMLETDTIEWSDSVTYRCQELLKGESKRSNIPVTLSPVKLLAQLVRDERILLNDDALETSGTVDLKVDGDIDVGQPVVQVRKPDATDTPFMRHSIEQPCDGCRHVFDADSMTCPMCNTIRPSEWTDNNSPTPLR